MSRLADVHEALMAASEARALVQAPVWAKAWEALERELLARLMACGPTDDEQRYRLQVGIEAGRQVRRVLEHQGSTTASLEAELNVLEGRKKAPVA